MKGHNRPPVVIEFTPAEAAFLLANAEETMTMGLGLLGIAKSRESQEKVVASIEGFRPIRDKLREALKP